MIYSEEILTRWNDTDAALHVRPSMILTYMQECGWSHLNAIGQNSDALWADGKAFILTRIVTRYYRPIAPRERVRVETWVTHEPRGFFFPRYFRVRDGAGNTLADAASIWVLLNTKTHTPLTVDQFVLRTEADAPLDLTVPRRFRSAEEILVGERKVCYSDTDYNGHMNNTRYPDMLCDHLPAEARGHIRSMGINFIKEAPMGASFSIYRGERQGEDGKKIYTFSTRGEGGEKCIDAEICTDLLWEGGGASCL